MGALLADGRPALHVSVEDLAVVDLSANGSALHDLHRLSLPSSIDELRRLRERKMEREQHAAVRCALLARLPVEQAEPFRSREPRLQLAPRGDVAPVAVDPDLERLVTPIE